MKSSKIKYIPVLVLFLFLLNNLTAQEIVKHPGNGESLEKRWDWAVKTAGQNDAQKEFWVAYSIERLMGKNSHFGCCDEDTDNSPSLADVIAGRAAAAAVKTSGRRRFSICDGDSGEKELKKVALLFRCRKNTDGQLKLLEITINDLNLPFDLENRSLFWLGNFDDNPSFVFLKKQYKNQQDTEMREDLITAIGIHQRAEGSYSFLAKIIKSAEEDDVREQAIFWIAQQKNKNVYKLLRETALNDRSTDVREQAVFGLYLTEDERATDFLIQLAREATRMDVRKKAIFWLGQRASEKSVKYLEDAVFEDNVTELQTHAVFAISQLKADEALPRLIKISKTHPNPQVRKKAIFWLGQCEDERALDAIISFLKDK